MVSPPDKKRNPPTVQKDTIKTKVGGNFRKKIGTHRGFIVDGPDPSGTSDSDSLPALKIGFSSCTLLWGDCWLCEVIIAGDMHQKRDANTKNEEFLQIFLARSVAVGQLYHKVGQKVN